MNNMHLPLIEFSINESPSIIEIIDLCKSKKIKVSSIGVYLKFENALVNFKFFEDDFLPVHTSLFFEVDPRFKQVKEHRDHLIASKYTSDVRCYGELDLRVANEIYPQNFSDDDYEFAKLTNQLKLIKKHLGLDIDSEITPEMLKRI